MKTGFWILAGSVLTILLVGSQAGCTLFDVLTFQSDEMSFQRTNSRATIEVYRGDAPDNCKQTKKVAAAFVAPAATYFLQMMETKIQSYLDRKKKEFTANYNAIFNAPYYYDKGDEAAIKEGHDPYIEPAFNCIKLQRTVLKDGKEEVALVWVGNLLRNESGTALQIRTEDLGFNQAAARTDKSNRMVDLSIEVKIDATILNDRNEIQTTTVADKTLAFPGSKIRGIKLETKPESSWFPAIPRSQKEIDRCEKTSCKGVSALTISVLVTEIGSGGDAFGELSKQIGDNKKTLEDTVNKALTNALSPKPTGGTSQGSAK